MPNTSVHFPDGILAELDEAAAARGMSRNRLIVESCRRTLAERQDWPAALFAADRLSAEDLAELRSGRDDFDRALHGTRRSRKAPPF